MGAWPDSPRFPTLSAQSSRVPRRQARACLRAGCCRPISSASVSRSTGAEIPRPTRAVRPGELYASHGAVARAAPGVHTGISGSPAPGEFSSRAFRCGALGAAGAAGIQSADRSRATRTVASIAPRSIPISAVQPAPRQGGAPSWLARHRPGDDLGDSRSSARAVCGGCARRCSDQAAEDPGHLSLAAPASR